MDGGDGRNDVSFDRFGDGWLPFLGGYKNNCFAVFNTRCSFRYNEVMCFFVCCTY